MLRLAPLTLALALLLLACAPGAVGSANRPIDLASASTLTMSPGDTLYMRLSGPPERFRLGAEVFANTFALPLGPDGSVRQITREFSLVDIRAPEGWSWRVESARVEDRPGSPVRLEVVLRLDVPRDARFGGVPISADLLARSSNVRERVSLVAQVVPQR